jgi:membrane protein required for colicin V production
MNWLDAVIIATAIILGFVGLWRGAVRTAFGIAGLIGGIALAGHYYGWLADALFPDGAVWTKIAAYALILLAALIAANVIGLAVSRLVHITMLGWLDRLIGFILGAGIGSMLWAAVLAIISKYLPSVEGAISQSAVAKFLMEQFPLLLALLPEEFDVIRDFFSSSGQVC